MLRNSKALLLCGAIIFSQGVSAEELVPPVQPEMAPPAMAEMDGNRITLSLAIERALARSSRLKSVEAAVGASKGEQRQAGALPNPAIGVEAENIAGQGSYKGFDSAEVTAGVSQLIEIGGKRSARQAAADQGHAIARLQHEGARLDLIRDVTIAYAEAVAAKEAVALAEKQESLAAEVLENVTKRVNAAAAPLFQKSKAEVALASSEVALDKARRDYVIARRKLAALWDGQTSDFDLDSASFFQIGAPQSAAAGENLKLTPDLVRWDAEEARSRAQLELEEANALPDPTVSVGLRDFQATGEQAFVVGVSIPIPIFNANQGNIAKARSELARTASEKRSAEIALDTEYLRSRQELENAYRQAEALKDKIIPAAEKAYALSRQGYQAGKFPYLEVLDAQRTLVEARAQYNDSLKTYHSKRAEVERLSARHQLAANEEGEDHD